MHQTFLDFVDSSDLVQHMSQPTHTKGNTLDLVLTNLTINNLFTEPSCSDHHVLSFDLIFGCSRSPKVESKNTTPYWLFQHANIPGIIEGCYDIENMINNSIAEDYHISHTWSIFKTGISDVAATHIPSRSRKKLNNTWLSRESRREIAKRRRWHKTCLRFNDEFNRERVRKQSKLCSKLVNRDYNAFINRHICDNLENGNTKSLFKFIGTRRGNSNTIKQLDGCLTDTNEEIADKFATAFTSVFTVDDGNRPDFSLPSTTQQNPIVVHPLGVLKQLRSLDDKKGAGPDGLSAALLKFLSPYIYIPLSMILQQSIDTCSTPRDWRVANVIPVYKKGSRSEPLNYRPISLTSITSKILEHIISSNIHHFLDTENLLSQCQHGFRAKHGCDTQLLTTMIDLVDSYDSNTPVDIAVLDFRKAFDVVSHPKLLLKLGAIGIHPSTSRWIEDWLFDRHLSVIVNGVTSGSRNVTSGVPQGSVLGPLLFLIYINDMPNVVLNSDLRLFADDSLVYRQITTPSDSQLLQADLDRLQTWATTWQMQFNVQKCEYMRLSRRSREPDVIPIYYLNDCSLTPVSVIKYLGIYIDEHLTFNRHINETCKKATGTLHMLMRTLKKARLRTRSLAYKTICRPILEYASQSWSPHMEKHNKSLEAINRKAFRWAHYKRKYDHISDLMVQEAWQTLQDRRRLADLNFYFRVLSGDAIFDQNKITIHFESSHETRTGALKSLCNTNVKRFHFTQRMHKYLHPLKSIADA